MSEFAILAILLYLAILKHEIWSGTEILKQNTF